MLSLLKNIGRISVAYVPSGVVVVVVVVITIIIRFLIAKKIKTDHTNATQYIKSTPANSFYLTPVTQAQVFALFATLKAR